MRIRSAIAHSALLACLLVPAAAQAPDGIGPAAPAKAAAPLPLELKRHDHVVFIGNTLFDRAQDFGWFETMLHQAHPSLELTVRTLAWSADEVDLAPRPMRFGSRVEHLRAQAASVIIAAYGFNESFAGPAGLEAFRAKLRAWLRTLRTTKFNGQAQPRVILVSPIRNEDVPGVPAASRNHANLAAYTKVMAAVAAAEGVGFVDVFTKPLGPGQLTFNGIHLLDRGYRLLAERLFHGVFAKAPPPPKPALRAAVLEKNRQFQYRYRPLNSFYYVGGRKGPYGKGDFEPAMRRFDVMLKNRDRRIWDLAQGQPVTGRVDDRNAPPLPKTRQRRPANRWMSPADERKAFRVDPRFSVECFASEEDFPELACPIQMRWDARGRLWVSCSTTYPHVYPGNAAVDKIIVLEDKDGDGRADASTVFADDLHIPLSFEFGDGGLYVSEPPHLTLLKDTDGDGRADWRRKVLTGFGTEDSHHSLHDFVWTPDGDLLARDSIFLHSQVETPYGPIRLFDSGWFRFRPSTHQLTAFGMYRSTNPWGVTFDDWGQHVASHPIFASAFHSLNPKYPGLHPRPRGIPAYSGTCGQEFIDMASFPDDLQGCFVKVRYKPTNRVELHRWVEHADHYEEKYLGDILFSSNLSFIPVDVRFGPRGALYVLDWYNPVKGHSQYSLRDDRRDRKSGRIWRITAKGRPLLDPPRIAGASTPELLRLLERREYRYRYWAKRELRERQRQDPKKLLAALRAWQTGLQRDDARFRHHQLEALWQHRDHESFDPGLLRELLRCDEHHARAAATRQLRHWHARLADSEELLQKAAADPNGLVRLEAVIAASYIGTPGALNAVLAAMQKPRSKHLDYAIACALGSHRLEPLALAAPHRETVLAFWRTFQKKQQRRPRSVDAGRAQFDTQRNLKLVKISCVAEKMKFTVERFEVRPNQPVKIVFDNPDATDHNLVLVRPGQALAVGMAAAIMARDPKNANSEFIPKSHRKQILHFSRMIGPTRKARVDVMRFRAPKQPGVYPYICTFPGHFTIMKGEMIVKE